jgi:hypothetical protein
MPSYAILPSSEQGRLDRALMIVPERHEADEIAAELNRRGQSVVVREVHDPPTG